MNFVKKVKFLATWIGPDGLKKILISQIFMVTIVLCDTLLVLSIGPFVSMALFGTTNAAGPITDLVSMFDGLEEQSLIAILAVFLIALILSTSFLAVYATSRMIKITSEIGAYLSSKQFYKLVNQPYDWHTDVTSAKVINDIAFETMRVANLFLLPFLNSISRSIALLFLLGALFLVDPLSSSLIFLFLLLLYGALFLSIKDKILRLGARTTMLNERRIETISECFHGIREVLLQRAENLFYKRYQDQVASYVEAQARLQILSSIPKYFVEMTAFTSLVIGIAGLSVYYNGNVAELAPKFAVFALATIKMLPALQSLFVSISTMRGHAAALDSLDIYNTQSAALRVLPKAPVHYSFVDGNVSDILLEKVTVKLSGRDVLKSVSLSVSEGERLGIVGSSGSGKSTLLDVICGLRRPSVGKVLVNGKEIYSFDNSWWKNKISYVSQASYIFNSSILYNITLKSDSCDVDNDLLNKALQVSQLHGFISSLPDGLNTVVGQFGATLSGGQRQRIGIARALYRNPGILVLDEATSSLDSRTENDFIEALFSTFRSSTIILATHRDAALSYCSTIYKMENGNLQSLGFKHEY